MNSKIKNGLILSAILIAVLALSCFIYSTFFVRAGTASSTAYYTPYVWVLNWDRYTSTVTKIDVTTGQTIGTYNTGGASNRQVAVDVKNNRVWVTHYDTNNIGKLDATTGQLLQVIPVGVNPYGIAVDKNGDVFVVNNSCYYGGHDVWKLDGSTGAVIWKRYVFQWPQTVAIDKNGDAWISTATEWGRTAKLRGSDGALLAIYWGGGTVNGNAIDLDGNIWRTDGGAKKVYKHSATDWSILAAISNIEAWSLTVDQNGNIWVPCYKRLVKIKASDGAIISDYTIDTPGGAAVDQQGNIWTPSINLKEVIKFDGSTGMILGVYSAGNNPGFGGDATGIIPQMILGVVIDKTPPQVIINTPADRGEYILNQVVLADWSAHDSESGIASATGTTLSGEAINTSVVGAKTYSVTAIDNAGNETIQTVTYYVRYVYGGILQPINRDGSSIFKLGSTVPVKFQLQDANGNFVANATVKLYLAKISNNVVGDYIEAISTSRATTDNLFRYDTASNQYIFNLGTKTLSTGTWQLRILLDDGTSKYVVIGLR